MTRKKLEKIRIPVLVILVLSSVILLSSLANANILYCLYDGEQLPPDCSGDDCMYSCDLSSGSGYCQICTTDSGTPGVNPSSCFGQTCSFLGGSGPDLNPPEVTINSPIEGNTYGSLRVPFDIEVDSKSRIEYRLPDDTSWHRLCSACKTYSGLVRLEEGQNEVSIRVRKFSNDLIVIKTINLAVDSEEPRIRGYLPKDGEYANEEFIIEYTELNLDRVELNYKGSDETDWNTLQLEGCESGDSVTCSAILNLLSYENKELEYFFSVCDSALCKSSEVRTVKIDNTSPTIEILEEFETLYDQRRILFKLSTDEESDIFYVDNNDGRSPHRERRLCSRCTFVSRKASFKDGPWDITVFARDKAGNLASHDMEFTIDTRSPRINKAEPRRGFTSGDNFEVHFTEANPTDLILKYGNSETGIFSKPIDIESSCTKKSTDKYVCSTDANLETLNGQRIDSWFELTDIVNRIEESRGNKLNVDTIFPIINSITHEIDRTRAKVTIQVDEENLEEVIYINNAHSTRERLFCSRLDTNGECSRRITLVNGQNPIDIIVVDKAGNSIAQTYTIEL